MLKTLRSRVIATYFLVVLISLLLATLFFVFFFSGYTRDRDRETLKREVIAIAEEVRQVAAQRDAYDGPRAQTETGEPPADVVEPPPFHEGPPTAIQRILDREARVIEAKLLITDDRGLVVAETGQPPMIGGRELRIPPELIARQESEVAELFSQRFDKEYIFAASPTALAYGNPAFIMAVKPAGELYSAFSSFIWYAVIAGLVSLAFSMLLALYLSGAISRPVKAVTAAARQMAAGDYQQEVKVKGPSEIRELAEDFNEMAERVRIAYELQENFVGNVSHELMTPLTSIEGFSQALMEGVSQSEAERERSLEIINQESKRLVRVLRDLLLLSRIDAGELRTEKVRVDLTDLMRKIESLYRGRAEERGIEFAVETPAGDLSMMTDPDRLEQVLNNLLENALKYTEGGGKVTVSASSETDSVIFEVTDTGMGIEPEKLPHLFERFYRVEKSRSTRHGGVGLGLSICKELVEGLGGNISVQSLVGHGTRFTVTLPM